MSGAQHNKMPRRMRFEIAKVKTGGFFWRMYDRAGHLISVGHMTYDRKPKVVAAIKAIMDQSKRAHIVEDPT